MQLIMYNMLVKISIVSLMSKILFLKAAFKKT